MTRVSGGSIATKNPFGPTWSKGEARATEGPHDLGQQIEHELFGRKKPVEVDADDSALSAQLARLTAFMKKLARFAGDAESDYRLALAQDGIAMIDGDGVIYLGRAFLLSHPFHAQAERNDALAAVVGVLAHEIGHRPKRWREARGEAVHTRAELDALCRVEETRADFFAGRALAELGFSPEPLCALLATLEEGQQPHPQYFSAVLRIEVIREGHADGGRQSALRKKMFPELARHVSARHDLGLG